MKILVKLFVLVVFVANSTAHAQAENIGTKAYAAISGVANALGEKNVRYACRYFGKYEALKSMANQSNTDVWTLRNLGFNDASDRVLAEFCAGPTSGVSFEDAIKAANAATGTMGLE